MWIQSTFSSCRISATPSCCCLSSSFQRFAFECISLKLQKDILQPLQQDAIVYLCNSVQDFIYVVFYETEKSVGSLGEQQRNCLFLFIFFFFWSCGVQIQQEVKIPIQLFSQILNRFRQSYEVISHLVTTHKCVSKCNRFQISG